MTTTHGSTTFTTEGDQVTITRHDQPVCTVPLDELGEFVLARAMADLQNAFACSQPSDEERAIVEEKLIQPPAWRSELLREYSGPRLEILDPTIRIDGNDVPADGVLVVTDRDGSHAFEVTKEVTFGMPPSEPEPRIGIYSEE